MKPFVLLMVSCAFSLSVYAKEGKTTKNLESSIKSACKKEYSSDVKGKNFSQLMEWIETKEHSADSSAFKKSRCYSLHEKWEGQTGHNESEEGEHHD